MKAIIEFKKAEFVVKDLLCTWISDLGELICKWYGHISDYTHKKML